MQVGDGGRDAQVSAVAARSDATIRIAESYAVTLDPLPTRAHHSRHMSLMSRLFATKSLDELIAGTQEEGHQLKKTLGPWNLIALGIGAIIGAGIFATIGTAAAGDAHRPGAGPALMLSFVLTAIVCGFSALCYAEFASMVPGAGSAYTYSFATLGELIAWIIRWDLM